MPGLSIFLLATLGSAQAATWTVANDGSGDHDSIQGAIDAAASGDVIEVGAGTWSEQIDYSGKDLVIRGTAGSGSTTLHGGGTADYLVRIVGGENATFEGFSLDNYWSQGLLIDGSIVEIVDVYAEGLGSDEDLGGVVQAHNSTVDIQNSTFDDNAAAEGAVVHGSGWSDIAVSDSHFEENTALGYYGEDEEVDARGDGGAVYVRGDGSLTIVNSTFISNTAYQAGGAVYTRTYEGTVSISDSSFEDNTASNGTGGAASFQMHSADVEEAVEAAEEAAEALGEELSDADIYGLLDMSVTFSGCTFEDNKSNRSNGGALRFYGQAQAHVVATVTTSEFSYNAAGGSGGALEANTLWGGWPGGTDEDPGVEDRVSNLTLSDLTFTDNSAGSGGGLSVGSAVWMDMDRNTFSRNNAGSSGGGAYFASTTVVDIDDCVFEGNDAETAYGGGIAAVSLDSRWLAEIDGSRFSDNSALLEGGGLYLKTAPETRIEQSLFEGNEAGSGSGSFGGGIYADDSLEVLLYNSVLRSNAAAYGGGAYINDNTQGSEFYNNVFVDNDAWIGGGIALCNSSPNAFINNTLVGNRAHSESSGVAFYESQIDIRNNIFAFNTGGAALHLYDLNSVFLSTFGYNDFYGNDTAGVAGVTSADVAGYEIDAEAFLAADNNMSIDPQFAHFTLGMAGDEASLVLASTSPLIDAGDPSPAYNDRDGSPNDVGAYGGYEFESEDLDGDGYDNSVDCDDRDPTIHPGAEETWYDGINSDCLTTSDYDADGDGVDAEEGGGSDCDDQDPTKQDPEDCIEPEETDTGEPEETEEEPEEVEPEEDETEAGGTIKSGAGCGCSATPTSGLAWAWLMALGLVRRRRA